MVNTPLHELLGEAWRISRVRHGGALNLCVPGMFVLNGKRGRYQAVSITGSQCSLNCDHCCGTLLKSMPAAPTPEALIEYGLKAWENGEIGILVTGGCDDRGALPWKRFSPAIEHLKMRTGLKISVHSGLVTRETALLLKSCGVDQALLDVIGDDETFRRVYHLDNGLAALEQSLESLSEAGLEIVPHIIYGLLYGREQAEMAALEAISSYPIEKYVVVVLTPTRGTIMSGVSPPAPEEVAHFLAQARIAAPDLKASLGCARPRGKYSRLLETYAIQAGVNSMALYSDEAVAEALKLGLDLCYHETCCSLWI